MPAPPSEPRHEHPSWASRKTLEANLAALDRVAPELAGRLRWPVESGHVRFDDADRGWYRFGRSNMPLGVSPREVDEHLRHAVRGEGTVFLFGLGLGEMLDRWLAVAGERPALVWERDPWLVRLTLMRRDYSDAILSRRLRFSLCSDVVALAARRPWSVRVDHPFLAGVYAWERELSERGAGDRRALLVAGELYVDSMHRALVDEGYAVLSLDTQRLALEELELTVRRFGPELVACINHHDDLTDFCGRLGVPLVCWEIDPTSRAPAPVASPTEHVRIHTYRRSRVEAFRRAGYVHVEHTLLAADTSLRHPVPPGESKPCEAPISFVGSSVVGRAEEFRSRFADEADEWRPGAGPAAAAALREILAEQRADPTRFVVPELVEARFPGWRSWSRAAGRSDPAILAGEIAAAEKRLSWIANLGRFGLEVWGDEGWRLLEEHGVTYRGYAAHKEPLNRIYCGSTINLDIGRIYQSDIVTMRVYDILACGGFVLAEHSPDLERAFDVGAEIESYRDLGELQEKVQHYLAHPAEARAVAERGRRAVLERHDFRDRVRAMLSGVPRARRAG